MSRATKNDVVDNKIPTEYLTLDGIASMCRAFKHGGEKYDDYNYYKGHTVNQLCAAAIRHILQFKDGEDVDSESKVSHLGHAMASLAMIEKQRALGTSIDDRYKGGQTYEGVEYATDLSTVLNKLDSGT